MPNRRGDARGVRRLWRDYSLSIVVGSLFVLSFHLWLRGKEVNFRSGFIPALVLVGLGSS